MIYIHSTIVEILPHVGGLTTLVRFDHFYLNHLFWIGYSDILSKLPTVIYPLCFKKQTRELLLYLSFKEELRAINLQYDFLNYF